MLTLFILLLDNRCLSQPAACGGLYNVVINSEKMKDEVCKDPEALVASRTVYVGQVHVA